MNEEILNKIDSLHDLPVSEEMIGAYIEGNLSDYELMEVEQLMQFEPELTDFIDDISQPEQTYSEMIPQETYFPESFFNDAGAMLETLQGEETMYAFGAHDTGGESYTESTGDHPGIGTLEDYGLFGQDTPFFDQTDPSYPSTEDFI